jgi:Flp pilus assembly protein TadG
VIGCIRGIGRDRGSAALEAAIIAPALLGLLCLAICAMRVGVAKQSVDAAAHDAARAASISRTESAAVIAAGKAVSQSLANQGITCRNKTPLKVNAGQFGRPAGQPAVVRVTVTCVVDIADVSVPGTPGSVRLTASYVSPIDSYRSRG